MNVEHPKPNSPPIIINSKIAENPRKQFSFQLRDATQIQPLASPSSVSNDYSFIYQELIRITSFTLLAIFLQFVLVWILRTK